MLEDSAISSLLRRAQAAADCASGTKSAGLTLQPFLCSDSSREAQRPAALLTQVTATPQPPAIQHTPAEAPAAGLVCISPLSYFMWMFTVFMFYLAESFLPTRLGKTVLSSQLHDPLKTEEVIILGP